MSTNITLVGNVTREPELKFSHSGNPVTKFSVAVNKKSKNGDDSVSFFEIVTFNSLAENVANSLRKGNRVIVQGNLNVAKYEKKDGTQGTAVEVLADNIGAEMRFNQVSVGEKSAFKASPAISDDEPW